MIGHVQSRKAELVCNNFDYVHSLDSLKLAVRYNRHAGVLSRKLPVLLQFNVSGEESKSGWDAWTELQWDQLIPEMEKILTLENIQVRGIMTMPPYAEDPEEVRPYFRRLVQLRNFLYSRFHHLDWNELSMGMSGDFEVAIQEGATWVRIGQAILGPRN
jgi:pyridoxal phosphate enzyme (YggS family)